jgi:hypothetical protein
MTRRLVTTSFGQLHCRLLGSGPPLIVLPAANGPRAIAAIVALGVRHGVDDVDVGKALLGFLGPG